VNGDENAWRIEVISDNDSAHGRHAAPEVEATPSCKVASEYDMILAGQALPECVMVLVHEIASLKETTSAMHVMRRLATVPGDKDRRKPPVRRH